MLSMALARWALKSIHKRSARIPSSAEPFRIISSPRKCNGERVRSVRGFSEGATSSDDTKTVTNQVMVQEGKGERESGPKKSKWFPMSLPVASLWKNKTKGRDALPFDLQYVFPSGLGDALLQATENFNRVFEKLTPSGLIGRVNEREDCYQIKYQLPGVPKEAIKMTVEDGVLNINVEHKQEGDEDDWSSYEYSNTSLVLPDDAKAEQVTAEMKDGVLCIIIPRTEKPAKPVRQIQIK